MTTGVVAERLEGLELRADAPELESAVNPAAPGAPAAAPAASPVPRPASAAGWTLFPHIIVRTTGFPFEMLEALRYPEAARSARTGAKGRVELEALKSRGPRVHRPSKSLLSALKAGRPVDTTGLESPDSFAEYNRHAEATLAADTSFESAFVREEAATRKSLDALSRDERFLEAVASSSPPVFLDLVRGRWGNRLDRQVASYLQRLCSKNETMSFFGPINYGRLDESAADSIRMTWSGPGHLRGRNTFAASWMVLGIMRAVAFDPAICPWLVLRRKAFAEVPTRKGAILPEPGAAPTAEELIPKLVERAEGSLPVRALALGLGVPLELACAAARMACEKGLLTHQLEIPAAVHHPLDDFAERLAGIPGPTARAHLASLRDVIHAVRRYSEAPAAEKVALNDKVASLVRGRWNVAPPAPLRLSEAPGASSKEAPAGAGSEKRGEGHNFYRDRLPLREECGGDLRLNISGARASELVTRAARSLGLMGEAALRTREAARASVAQLMGVRRVPFWKVVAAYSDKPIPSDTSVARAFAEGITDPTAHRFDLTHAPFPSVRTHSELPLVTSVDLLVGAASLGEWEKGNYEVVLGDVHDTALVWGWALQFHEKRAHVESDMVQALGTLPRPVPLITVLASRRTGLLPSEFPGPVVELGGVSSRASNWKLPFDDLFVESDGKQARLISTRLGGEVCLYNGEMESLVHTAFALPRIRPLRANTGRHTPRLELDGVILQRESWMLDQAGCEQLLACKDDRQRLRAAVQVWDRLGLPEQVFAKFKEERKPILVDCQSPLLLRVFVNLLEQKQEVLLSEMFPGPGQLWLAGDHGRHTSELRATFFWSGTGAPEVKLESKLEVPATGPLETPPA